MLPDESVQMCCTSPPYWGLRDYGVDRQYGLEPTIEEYVDRMVEVFHEVRRVLRKDGVLWLNLGDSYASGGRTSYDTDDKLPNRGHSFRPGAGRADGKVDERGQRNRNGTPPSPGLKPKDLCGIPWRVALALQADGWWLRSDIIWAKPNPMPESCTDRPTTAHEHIFLLTKAAHYFYDAEAVKQLAALSSEKRGPVDFGGAKGRAYEPEPGDPNFRNGSHQAGRTFVPGPTVNLRSVWTIATAPFPSAHFATFPPAIPERCIKAGTSEKGCCPKCGASWVRVVEKETQVPPYRKGNKPETLHAYHGESNTRTLGMVQNATTTGWTPTCTCNAGEPVPCTVLDIFSGAGTTALVAAKLGRDAIGIELNPEYVEISRKRIAGEMGMLCEIEVKETPK
jgi:DNA modification methylase